MAVKCDTGETRKINEEMIEKTKIKCRANTLLMFHIFMRVRVD